MPLIQGGRRRRLLLGLLSHLRCLLDRVDQRSGSKGAKSQPRSRHEGRMNASLYNGSHDAGSQLYLNDAVHRAMTGNTVKIDDWGAGDLGIYDAALGTEARGSI